MSKWPNMTRWDAICIAVSESKPLRPGEGARIIAFVEAFLDGRTIECAAKGLREVADRDGPPAKSVKRAYYENMARTLEAIEAE